LRILEGISNWWDAPQFEEVKRHFFEEKFPAGIDPYLGVLLNAPIEQAGVWCDFLTLGCGNAELVGKGAAISEGNVTPNILGHEFTHGLQEGYAGLSGNEYISEFIAYPMGVLFNWFYSGSIDESYWVHDIKNHEDIEMGLPTLTPPTWGLFTIPFYSPEKLRPEIEWWRYLETRIYSLISRIFFLSSFSPVRNPENNEMVWDIWRYYTREVFPIWWYSSHSEVRTHLESILANSIPLFINPIQSSLSLMESIDIFLNTLRVSADIYANTLPSSDYLNIYLPLTYNVNALGFWSSPVLLNNVSGYDSKGYGKVVPVLFSTPEIEYPGWEEETFFERCGADESSSYYDICWVKGKYDTTLGYRTWERISIANELGVPFILIKDFDAVSVDIDNDGYQDYIYIAYIHYFTDEIGVLKYDRFNDEWTHYFPQLYSEGIYKPFLTDGNGIEIDEYSGHVYASYINGNTSTIHVLDLIDYYTGSIDTNLHSIVPPAIAGYKSYDIDYQNYNGLFISYSEDGTKVKVKKILPEGSEHSCEFESMEILEDKIIAGPISMYIYPQGVYKPQENDFPRFNLTGEFNIIFKVSDGSYQQFSFIRDPGNQCEMRGNFAYPVKFGNVNDFSVSPQLGKGNFSLLMAYRTPVNPVKITFRRRWGY